MRFSLPSIVLPALLLLPSVASGAQLGSAPGARRDRRRVKSSGSYSGSGSGSGGLDVQSRGEFPSVSSLSRMQQCAASSVKISGSVNISSTGKNGKSGGKSGKSGKQGGKSGGKSGKQSRELKGSSRCGKNGKSGGKSGKQSRELWFNAEVAVAQNPDCEEDEGASISGDLEISFTPNSCDVYCPCYCGETEPNIRAIVSGGVSVSSTGKNGKNGGKNGGKSGGKSGKQGKGKRSRELWFAASNAADSGKGKGKGKGGSSGQNTQGYFIDMAQVEDGLSKIQMNCDCKCGNKGEKPTLPEVEVPLATPKPSPQPSRKPTFKATTCSFTEEECDGVTKICCYPQEKCVPQPFGPSVCKPPSEAPTPGPTGKPTRPPTPSPSRKQTPYPSPSPTKKPTPYPSAAPTKKPSKSPTKSPTLQCAFTGDMCDNGTHKCCYKQETCTKIGPFVSICMPPTSAPTPKPSRTPTKFSVLVTPPPTDYPTARPTAKPTLWPTPAPSARPTKSPSASPTKSPSARPTPLPTLFPTRSPTEFPTPFPTRRPTLYPTRSPTDPPSASPTFKPTLFPTKRPTPPPTPFPTASPTDSPTAAPTCINEMVCVKSHESFPEGTYDSLAGWSFQVNVDTTLSCSDEGVMDLGWVDDGLFDFLLLMRDGEEIMSWGDSCPDEYPVKAGDKLVFYSDNSHEYPGFEVCLAAVQQPKLYQPGFPGLPGDVQPSSIESCKATGQPTEPDMDIFLGNCFLSHPTWNGVNTYYENFYGWSFPVDQQGKISARNFNIRGIMTGQALSLWRNGEMIQKWQGTTGPDGEMVYPGDELKFIVDDSAIYSYNTGFMVCYDE